MSTETQTPPAAPVTKNVVVNGKPLTFAVGTVARGDHKGAPVLAPAFKVPGKPDLAEFTQWVATLGTGPLLKKFASVFRTIIAEACESARVKTPEGKVVIDDGKFNEAVLSIIADLDAGGKDQLYADLEEINKAFNDLFASLLSNYISKGQPVPAEKQNEALQIMKKRTDIEQKLAKKTRAPKTAAPKPAAPAPAAA